MLQTNTVEKETDKQDDSQPTTEQIIMKEAFKTIKEKGVENFDMENFLNNKDVSDKSKQFILFEAYKDRLPDRKYYNGTATNVSTQVSTPEIWFDGYFFDNYELFKNYIMSDFDVRIYEEYLKTQFITLAEYEEFIMGKDETIDNYLFTREMKREEAETIAKAEAEKTQEVKAETPAVAEAPTVEKIDPRTVSIESGTYLSANREITVFGTNDGVVDIALADSFGDTDLDVRSFIFSEAFKNKDGSISITKTTIWSEQLTIYPNGTGFKLNDEIFYRVAKSQAYTKLGFDYIDYHNQNFIDNWYNDFSEAYKGIIKYVYDYGDESLTDKIVIYKISKIEEVLDNNGHNYSLKYTATSSEDTQEFTVYFYEDRISN